MLTGFHTYAYKNEDNLKVVTIRFFAFLSGCILALLIMSIVCNYSSREDSCCKHKKLVTGNEATVHLVKRDCKFAMFRLPDQESVPIMPA